jgi:cyclopropane fatty-acyl-phospholipid synthase-like methyltransferase
MDDNESLNQGYDAAMTGEPVKFDRMGFYNFGYWEGVENSVELAQINLMEHLASFFSKPGCNVLDVACGKGASCRFLTKYFDPKNITGINISAKQLQVCAVWAPGCNFELADPTHLSFSDSSFDNVMCIQSAFHFRTRSKFFGEAYRVLKPDGRLALDDFIVHDSVLADAALPGSSGWPDENRLPSVAAYKDQLLRAGFRHVRVENTTQFGWGAWIDFSIKQAERELDYQALEQLQLQNEMIIARRAMSSCMAFAIK